MINLVFNVKKKKTCIINKINKTIKVVFSIKNLLTNGKIKKKKNSKKLNNLIIIMISVK